MRAKLIATRSVEENDLRFQTDQPKKKPTQWRKRCQREQKILRAKNKWFVDSRLPQ